MTEMAKDNEYSSVGIKTPTLERLKAYKRTMSHQMNRDMTINDVIAELMNAYCEQHQDVKTA